MKELIAAVILLTAFGLTGEADYQDAIKTQNRIAQIAQVDGGK